MNSPIRMGKGRVSRLGIVKLEGGARKVILTIIHSVLRMDPLLV
jgi:hypothetical protein